MVIMLHRKERIILTAIDIIDELGIQGLFVFLALFMYLFISLIKKLSAKNREFIVILISLWITIFVIGMFDHYFISLYQGQFLLFLLLWLCDYSKFPYPFIKS